MNVDPVGLEQALPTKHCLETVGRGRLLRPPCIRGKIIEAKPHDQLDLQCALQVGLPEVDASTISDQQILEYP
jgi:hypothetical protein